MRISSLQSLRGAAVAEESHLEAPTWLAGLQARETERSACLCLLASHTGVAQAPPRAPQEELALGSLSSPAGHWRCARDLACTE